MSPFNRFYSLISITTVKLSSLFGDDFRSALVIKDGWPDK